ncbi:MAG: hypothetical protein AVDCRST_MAG30-663, partial [uncultured Solirubrobacteraceae bacterium]
ARHAGGAARGGRAELRVPEGARAPGPARARRLLRRDARVRRARPGRRRRPVRRLRDPDVRRPVARRALLPLDPRHPVGQDPPPLLRGRAGRGRCGRQPGGRPAHGRRRVALDEAPSGTVPRRDGGRLADARVRSHHRRRLARGQPAGVLAQRPAGLLAAAWARRVGRALRPPAVL